MTVLHSPVSLPRGIAIRPAEARDSADLAHRLREIDVCELSADHDGPAASAIEASRKASCGKCYSVLLDGVGVIGMYGISKSPKDGRGGRIWLLGSELLLAGGIELALHSRPWIEDLMGGFEVVFNFISAENEIAIRWLKWCGFEFISLIPEYGLTKKPFWLFARANGKASRETWKLFFEQGHSTGA